MISSYTLEIVIQVVQLFSGFFGSERSILFDSVRHGAVASEQFGAATGRSGPGLMGVSVIVCFSLASLI